MGLFDFIEDPWAKIWDSYITNNDKNRQQKAGITSAMAAADANTQAQIQAAQQAQAQQQAYQTDIYNKLAMEQRLQQQLGLQRSQFTDANSLSQTISGLNLAGVQQQQALPNMIARQAMLNQALPNVQALSGGRPVNLPQNVQLIDYAKMAGSVIPNITSAMGQLQPIYDQLYNVNASQPTATSGAADAFFNGGRGILQPSTQPPAPPAQPQQGSTVQPTATTMPPAVQYNPTPTPNQTGSGTNAQGQIVPRRMDNSVMAPQYDPFAQAPTAPEYQQFWNSLDTRVPRTPYNPPMPTGGQNPADYEAAVKAFRARANPSAAYQAVMSKDQFGNQWGSSEANVFDNYYNTTWKNGGAQGNAVMPAQYDPNTPQGQAGAAAQAGQPPFTQAPYNSPNSGSPGYVPGQTGNQGIGTNQPMVGDFGMSVPLTYGAMPNLAELVQNDPAFGMQQQSMNENMTRQLNAQGNANGSDAAWMRGRLGQQLMSDQYDKTYNKQLNLLNLALGGQAQMIGGQGVQGLMSGLNGLGGQAGEAQQTAALQRQSTLNQQLQQGSGQAALTGTIANLNNANNQYRANGQYQMGQVGTNDPSLLQQGLQLWGQASGMSNPFAGWNSGAGNSSSLDWWNAQPRTNGKGFNVPGGGF